MPSVMNKDHKPSYSKFTAPVPDKKHEEEEFDISGELSGFGLQGVKMTNDELQLLAEELGLGKEDAAELAKGLGGLDLNEKKEKVEEPQIEPARVEEAKVEDSSKETTSGSTKEGRQAVESTAVKSEDKPEEKPTSTE